MSELDFSTDALHAQLTDTALAPWAETLGQAVLAQGHALKHGHLPGWESAVANLPACEDARGRIRDGVVTIEGSFSAADEPLLLRSLEALIPWRKGPFQFGPHAIDTEWRSDWKWDRIAPHLPSMDGQVVLDVGCGNGYHLWRMREAGAAQVLGIDPSLLYLKQFEAVQHYLRDPAVALLPLPMEALPESMGVFDTVFSMGVLYHRRDPMSHLSELRQALKPGGLLVLETLITPEQDDSSLRLTDRYANMRNIYELPSQKRLEHWVGEAGFSDIATVSVNTTSRSEQRSTRWMPSHSLAQALHPEHNNLTIEGHPRPLRATLLGRRP